MALPAAAMSALSKDMGDKGMTDGPMGDEPDEGPDKDKVYKQICGDAFDAVKSGDKEQFCNFMLELLERYNSDAEEAEGPEMPASEET